MKIIETERQEEDLVEEFLKGIATEPAGSGMMENENVGIRKTQ